MSLEATLTDRLKEAMKAKRTQELSVLRMVKALAAKEKTTPGFSGTTDDAFWTAVIAKYVKQQRKALEEFERLGASEEQCAAVRFEIDYLSAFLPKKASEEETAALVEAVMRDLPAPQNRNLGAVMGAVMRRHKDQVDPAVVRAVVERKLA